MDGWGALREEKETQGEKRESRGGGGGGGGGGLDLFEQSGCNESSRRSLGVDRWSEQRKEEGGTSELGEIQLQTDCWTW